MHWLVQSWLGLLVDVSVKSLFLAGIAAAALWLLRIRNANVRHRVWTSDLVWMLALPPKDEMSSGRHITNENGRFEIVGLAPGHMYNIMGYVHGKNFQNNYSGDVINDIELRPGEIRDLGTVTLKKPGF